MQSLRVAAFEARPHAVVLADSEFRSRWSTLERQPDDFPRFSGGCRFKAHFAYEPNESLDELDVGSDFALAIEQVVLQPDPDVAAQEKGVHGGRELGGAHSADAEL